MALLLAKLGHEIHGISDKALPNSHYELANVAKVMSSSNFLDIRNYEDVKDVISKVGPDMVVHLAAQAFVLEGYRRPSETFEVNVNGTINLLKACEDLKINHILVITSDKVYKVGASTHAFVESDSLGGCDPYSSSKAAADLISQTFSYCFSSTQVSIARAGNVIGGGDFGQDRLIPDLVKAHVNSGTALIRNPHSIRPWQHVLDCLDAYIRIMTYIIDSGNPGIWNVGPSSEINITVREVADNFSVLLGNQNLWIAGHELNSTFVETQVLSLNSHKIQSELGWYPKLDTEKSIQWTFEWYRGFISNSDAAKLTSRQISQYLSM